jgi:hypothetical protein
MSMSINLGQLADDLLRVAAECDALGRNGEASRLLKSGKKLRILATTDAPPIEIDPNWTISQAPIPRFDRQSKN